MPALNSCLARLLVLGAFASMPISASAVAVTVLNDNFNSYSHALGATAVGDWRTSSIYNSTAPGGGVDVIGSIPAPFYDFYPGNGNFIDLDGTGTNSGPTFFYIDVPMAAALAGNPGYLGPWRATLSFMVGQNPGGGAGGRQVTPYFAGGSIGSSVFSSSALTPYSRMAEFSELGGSLNSSYQVGFFTPSSDGQGPILDNVTLTLAPVPEPATYGLMLAGLGLLGFMARRGRTS